MVTSVKPQVLKLLILCLTFKPKRREDRRQNVQKTVSMGTETSHKTTRERTRTGGTQREKEDGRAVVRWTTAAAKSGSRGETESGDEMYTDLSEIWDVTLINPNLLCQTKQNKKNGKQTKGGEGIRKRTKIKVHYLMQ